CTRRCSGRLRLYCASAAQLMIRYDKMSAVEHVKVKPGNPLLYLGHEWKASMTKLLATVAFALGVFASSGTFAAERTLTLAVQNVYCDACPLIVRKSLEAVPGVAKAVVSFNDK